MRIPHGFLNFLFSLVYLSGTFLFFIRFFFHSQNIFVLLFLVRIISDFNDFLFIEECTGKWLGREGFLSVHKIIATVVSTAGRGKKEICGTHWTAVVVFTDGCVP